MPSLVGSEMCIRDRFNCDVSISKGEKSSQKTIVCYNVSIDCILEKLSEILYCLLYTSDAADDLLCVDLGGRRIIKKKKK